LVLRVDFDECDTHGGVGDVLAEPVIFELRRRLSFVYRTAPENLQVFFRVAS
jgi:hypothetical protein